MSETRTQFRWFSITEYDKEAEYLRDMHKSGWKFTRVSGLGMYHFVKCEPEDVVYQLDYNQEGIKNKVEYVQMFKDCGWEYMFDYVGYSYFRKPASQMDGEEEIFCDDESRLDMMKRVLKGRLLPLLIVFVAVIMPQMCMQIYYYTNDVSQFRGAVLGSYSVVFVLYMFIFISFTIKYNKFKKKTGRI